MRELDASELIYVNGGSDSITSGLTETETTLTTRGVKIMMAGKAVR